MKTLLTGIKPTSSPHLGNYVGSIHPAIEKIRELKGQSYLFIADYHSLTTIHQPHVLTNLVHEVACTLLSCGLDLKKTALYQQSHIPELFELYWILSCFTPKGLLNRAHSYKAKVQLNLDKKNKDSEHGISMGLFNYPILMAADILLFQADLIPVGKDQIQHIEMTRSIAAKFNQQYQTSIFKIPEPLIETKSHYLLGLDGRKMSKSYKNDIPLFCSPSELRKKIMKVKTDSLPPEAPKDPSNSILFQIYEAFAPSEKTNEIREKMKKGCSWGYVKNELVDVIENYISDKREIYETYLNQPKKVQEILKEGAETARKQASKVIQEVKEIIGL